MITLTPVSTKIFGVFVLFYSNSLWLVVSVFPFLNLFTLLFIRTIL